MTWAKRQMRRLIENLGDLAGHDIVIARHAERPSAERSLAPPHAQGWITATLRWLRRLLAMAPGGREPSCRHRAPTSQAPLLDSLEQRSFVLIPVGPCSISSIA